MEEVSGKHHPAFATWIDHPDYDDYWQATAVDEHFDKFTIPVLQVCGWYDLYAGGMMINHMGLREQAGSELARAEREDHHGTVDASAGRDDASAGHNQCRGSRFWTRIAAEYSGDREGVVRSLAEGHRQRSRARRAGQALRDG